MALKNVADLLYNAHGDTVEQSKGGWLVVPLQVTGSRDK
jgi:hypothetical protein